MTRLLDVREYTELGSFRGAWDRLATMVPEPTHTLASWWLDSAAKHEPRFLLVFDGDELIGGLPLEVERWRGLRRFRVLGHDMWPTDFTIVANPSRYNIVANEISAWFRSTGSYILELRGLSGSSELPRIVPPGIRANPVAPTWTAPLGEDFDGYLGTLSHGFRKETRRLRRRFEGEGFKVKVASPEEISGSLAKLRELHALQFGSNSSFLPFFERFARAAASGAESDQLFLYSLLSPANVPLGVDVWIRAGDRLLNYIGGRHPDAPSGAGTFLISAAIADSYHRGIQEISLGSGFGDWKTRWAPIRQEQMRLSGAVGARATGLLWCRDAANAALRWMSQARSSS